MLKSYGRKFDQFFRELSQSVYSLVLIILFSRGSAFRFSKLQQSKECLVLGNGPSLRADLQVQPEISSTRDVFCVNDFVRSDLYDRVKPSVYVILDPFYWEAEAGEREEFFMLLKKKTTWDMTLVMPQELKHSNILSQVGLLRSSTIRCLFFNRTPVSGFKWFTFFCFGRNFGLPWAQNVMVAAIFLALNLGYKKIYLLGADHSWHEELEVGSDNIVYVRQKHFYDADKAERRPVYKRPFRISNDKEYFTMYDIFAAWARMFKGYMILEEYSRYLGSKIQNAGSKSYIDAFERINLSAL